MANPVGIEDYLNSELNLTRLRFQVDKKALWNQKSQYAKKTRNKETEVFLQGNVYKELKEIKTVEKEKVDRTTVEGAISSIVSSSKQADKNWITNNFVSTDQKKIGQIYGNKSFLEKNKKFMDDLKGQYIQAFAKHQDYILVFVKQVAKNDRQVTEPIVLKKESGQWKQTIALMNDPLFDVVATSLTEGQVAIGQKAYRVDPSDAEKAAVTLQEKPKKTEKKKKEKSFIPKLF